MIDLRPDQQQALDAVLSVYQKQPTGGKALVVAATGWGKTIFFSFLAKKLQKEGNILIVAHREELIHQAIDKFCMIDPDARIGKVGGGSHQYGAPITVAGIDTISGEKHLKNLHKFGYKLVIWDECHHCQAPKYHKVREALPDAFHLGVTATPMRLDKLSLLPLFGEPVFQMPIVDAIRAGLLCDLRAIAIRTEVSLDEIGKSRNSDGETDFNQQELERAVDTQPRNQRVVESYQEHAIGRRALCFAVSVQHAHNLAAAFNNAGIPAAAISGDMVAVKRHPLYQQLRAGTIKVLCSVQVLTEGFDEPLISCVLMARPTQSQGLYIQSIGRGLRLAPGKKDCLILDLTDNSFRLRLTPQNIRSVLGRHLKPDETLLDTLAREEDEKADREASEKRAIIRKLNEKRDKDITLDLFALPEWQEKENGMFVMEVGLEKHRIALVPHKDADGRYDVWARLAPSYEAQKWLGGWPLDGCMQHAEKKAHMLLSEPKSVALVDRNAPWRACTPTEGQKKTLKWYRIPFDETITRGQASDLIDAHKQAIEARKEAKAEREKARMEA